MKKRILAMLMALVMVLSLCPTTAFAAPALPQDLILSDGVTTQQNPLYPDVEYADELMIPDAPISTLATSEDNYGTVEDIAVDIRENMKKRNTEFTVLYHHVAQSSDIEVVKEEIGAAFQEAFDLAIEHTGDPIEGDYLKWQWGRWGYSWSGSYSGSDFYVDFTITLEYYTTAAQEREMDQAVENLLDELDLDKASDYQKIRGIYDWVCHNVVYDYDNLEDESHKLKYTAYAALINGTSVCQGYANLFYRLALELGVDTRLIAGDTSGGAHSWNITELNDLYYYLDSTWDASVAEAGGSYQYFLKCSNNFPDHYPWAEFTTTEFTKAYPIATKDFNPSDDPGPTEPEPTEHTHSYTAVVTEPTCTEGGYTTYTCECGDSYTGNKTAALGHDEIIDAAVAPTCTETGLTEGKHCSRCGAVLVKQETVAATGHSFGAWVVVTEPTTENEGQEKRTCTACGATETRPIDKLPEETEPTEPEPTDPEPTEPEPTDPEPTDPAPGGKYPITVNVRTEGGTYDLRWQEAAAGNTVTVRLKPDEGYCLDSFEYSFDGEGGEITLYSEYIEITMPEGAVTLDLYYIPAFEIRTYRDDLIASAYTYTYINDFEVRAENAPEGRRVYLLVTPYPGMDIDQIVVYYGSSYPPEMYSLGKNEYGDDIFEIIMPDGDLEIYVTSTALEEHFVDVDEDDYYYDPVRWALRHKITAGIDDTHFAPNTTCSRAQVVSFLWRAAGQPAPTSTANPFSDVKASDYYYMAVLWAVENGITAGTAPGKFSPNAPCTRAQVATFLWRAVGEPSPSSDYNPFSDVKPGQYYTEAILWAVEYGITAGTGNGKFSPNAACSRGQIVTFLYRLEH